MAVIKFLVRGTSEASNIIVRFRNGRKFDYSTSTGLQTNPKYWDDNRQRVKNVKAIKNSNKINNQLDKLIPHINDSHLNDYSKGVAITKEWFIETIHAFFNQSTEKNEHKVYMREYMAYFIQEAKDGKRFVEKKEETVPVSKRTIQRYQNCLNKFIDFEKYKKKKYLIKDINLIFHKDFLLYLRSVGKYNENTIGKFISIIKTMLNEAKLNNIEVSPEIDSKKFKVPSSKPIDIYLNEDEIDLIFNHDFTNSERLDNVRDLFIIGLRTGLRVSDINRLHQLNLKDDFIVIKTDKTSEEVEVYMHDQIKFIINKHDGLPRRISESKFNKYVKEVCKEVGLDEIVEGSKRNPETNRKEKGMYPKYELVTTHTARRSFASNLYGHLSNLEIMAITGHKSESVFLDYIKISKKKHALKLKDHYEKQKKDRRRNN